MPDCFLSVAEGSADRLRLPHSSNDTNRLAILDSDGPALKSTHHISQAAIKTGLEQVNKYHRHARANPPGCVLCCDDGAR